MIGRVLVDPIEVACDRACADIHVHAYGCIAEVAEMSHLGAGPKVGILDFAEVAHMDALRQVCAFTKMGKRADVNIVFDTGLLKHRVAHHDNSDRGLCLR